MLFLLTLLAAVISTGAIEQGKKAYDKNKKRKEKELERQILQQQKAARAAERMYKRLLREQERARKQAEREERERRRNILKLPAPKKLTKAQIIRRFEELDEQEMKICRNNVKKAMTNPHWRIGREFAEFKKMLNEVFNKRVMSKDVSGTDKRLINVAVKLFVPESGWTKYQPLRSSWLIVAKYSKSKRELVVQMRRGKVPYHFYRVPPWAYVALIVKMGNVGTMWWNKWYWRWSKNRKWKGQKKKWQKTNLSKG